jgi:uncharacterized membrane protein
MSIFVPYANPALRQRGSVLVPAAFAILLGVILLWGVQLGYAFYLKRDLQRTADLAALTGAQVLDRGLDLNTSCAAAVAAATAAVAANMSAATLDSPPVCMNWDASSGQAVLSEATESPNNGNAVQVVLSTAVPKFFPYFGGVSSVHALATAVRNGEGSATFTVGTKLVSTGSAPVPGSLMDVLSTVGLDLSGTSLVGYDGLADAHVTPGGLLQAMGITVPANVSAGQLNTLLSTQASLMDLLNAAVNTADISDAQKSGLLSANVTLAQVIAAKLGVNVEQLVVQLGSGSQGGGIFALLDTTDPNSFLNANIGLLDMIGASAGVASAGHAVQASIPVNISNLLTVTAQTGIIEGPSIGFGTVSQTYQDPKPSAYTSQVRAYVNVETKSDISILGLITIGIHLPIVIEGVNGKATLEKLCHQRDSVGPMADILGQSDVLKVCVGKPSNPPAGWPFSTKDACDANLPVTLSPDLISVKLLGANFASLHKPLVIPALPSSLEDNYHKGQVDEYGNNLAIGTTVQNLVDGLLAAVLGQGMNMGGGSANTIAQNIWNDTASICTANTATCHQQRMTAATARLEQDASGLQGFAGGLTSGALGVADSLATLNVGSLLSSVGNLAGGLLSGLNSLLGSLLSGGDPCWTLLGGSQESTCVGKLSSQISASGTSGATIALLGALTTALQPLLDDIGSKVLTSVITNLLGLEAGVTVIKLQDIDCTGKGVQLVQ